MQLRGKTARTMSAVLMVAIGFALSSCSDDNSASAGSKSSVTDTVGMSFWASPDFSQLKVCGPHCGLAVQPSPDSPKGTPYLLKEDDTGTAVIFDPRPDAPQMPPEKPGNPHWVFVLCQMSGPPKRNDLGIESRLWDRVSLPYDMLTPEAIATQGLTPGQSGVGYAPDIWLGNKDHKIRCT